jgi:RHS repeat-associated protein
VGGEVVYLAQNMQYSGSALTSYSSPSGILNARQSMLTGEPALSAATDPLGNPILHREVEQMDDQGNPLLLKGRPLPTALSLDGGTGLTDDEVFAYDDMNALASAKRPNAAPGSAPYTNISYTVDGTLEANRTSVVQYVATDDICGAETARTSSYTYNSGSNQLAGIVATMGSATERSEFIYDSAGNTIMINQYSCPDMLGCASDKSLRMFYDEAGRMVVWADVGSSAIPYDSSNVTGTTGSLTFAYDYRDLRTAKAVEGGAMTFFHYMDDGTLLTEFGAGNTARDYVWVAGRLVGVIDAAVGITGALDDSAAKVYNVHSGLLGEPLRMTDSGGAVVWSGDHDPFGNRAVVSRTGVVLNVGFPGQYFDPEIEDWNNWARVYGSHLGRYLTDDGFADIGLSQSSFGYANHNPLVYRDPSGRLAGPICFGTFATLQWWICGAALAATAAAIAYEAWELAHKPQPTPEPQPNPQPPPQPDPGGSGCNDDPCDQKLNDWQLQQAGICGRGAAHGVKGDALGTNKNLSKFDLCGCRDGTIVVKAHGCGGEILETTDYCWK